MKLHSLRLKPGQDLRFEIEKFAHDNDVQAGFVISCVGALSHANLRMPGGTPTKRDYKELDGPFEIISLVGTVSTGGCHLHIGIADEEGKALGGHVTDNCIISRTAEIVIGEDETLVYTRKIDRQTGFPELVVRPRT